MRQKINLNFIYIIRILKYKYKFLKGFSNFLWNVVHALSLFSP